MEHKFSKSELKFVIFPIVKERADQKAIYQMLRLLITKPERKHWHDSSSAVSKLLVDMDSE